jgi:hypothetical protein
MKGTIGLSGTTSRPFFRVIGAPSVGGFNVVNVAMA